MMPILPGVTEITKYFTLKTELAGKEKNLPDLKKCKRQKLLSSELQG